MMHRILRTVQPALLAILILAAVATVAEACPTCTEGLAADPVQQGMVRGYFYSILFMMAMPFVLLGSFGGYAYLAVRRARRAAEANTFSAPAESPQSAHVESEPVESEQVQSV